MDKIDEVLDLKPIVRQSSSSDLSIVGYLLSQESRQSIRKRTKKSQKKVHICSTCNYQTIHKYNLHRHKVLHLPQEERQAANESQNVYRCALCGYQTRFKSSLRRHEKVHLTAEERQIFACAQCDKKYMSNRRLQDHIKLNHIDSRMRESQKKVRCSICHFQTRDMSNLRQHEAVHLEPEERELFGCAHCEKQYMTKRHLKDHLKTNHSDSRMKESQKKVRCSICHYRTRDMSNLRKHEAVHLAPEERELFGCAHCKKQYMTKQRLIDHFKTNHNDSRAKELKKSQKKVYRCVTCGYQTPRRLNLYKHQQIHLAPDLRRMFACVWCDNKYTSNQRLQDHIKRNHINSRNPDCTSPTDEVILDSLKIEMDDTSILNDTKSSECISATNEIKSEDFIKTESDDVTPIMKTDMHNDFKNADCTSPTDEVILDSLKIEMDELTSILNDTKSSECISATNEIKSEDFIKTESDDVTPIMNRDMHNDFKNTEDLSLNLLLLSTPSPFGGWRSNW